MKRALLLLFILFCRTGFAQVSIIKIDDLEKRVKNSTDTTYIVNFWATWCVPCIKELPDFDSITVVYAKEKVKVLLVSMDFKEDLSKKILPFIKNKKVRSEVVILDEINGNYFIPKVSDQWSGALPATWIINNKAAINRFYEKKVTFDFLKNELIHMPQ